MVHPITLLGSEEYGERRGGFSLPPALPVASNGRRHCADLGDMRLQPAITAPTTAALQIS